MTLIIHTPKGTRKTNNADAILAIYFDERVLHVAVGNEASQTFKSGVIGVSRLLTNVTNESAPALDEPVSWSRGIIHWRAADGRKIREDYRATTLTVVASFFKDGSCQFIVMVNHQRIEPPFPQEEIEAVYLTHSTAS